MEAARGRGSSGWARPAVWRGVALPLWGNGDVLAGIPREDLDDFR